MFGIKFIKTNPTDYVLLYKNGKIKKQGAGLNFFYYAPSSNVVILPVESKDTPFIFNETTNDFQAISIQGSIIYKVKDPLKLAASLNFSVNSHGKYIGDGFEKLPLRLINLAQVILREKLKDMNLRDSLTSAINLVEHVRNKIKSNEVLNSLGLEVLDFSILKISATPEMNRALEASARENLLKEADDAIYQRRNFAVEQERKIKENEIQTQISMEEKKRLILEEQKNAEIAVQEKQKLVEDAKMNTLMLIEEKKNQIEDAKMTSGIKLEEKKKDLIKIQSENIINNSKAKAEALKNELSALNALSPDLLEVLAQNQMDPKKLLTKAIKEFAKNASKIGNLNISTELLNEIITAKDNPGK